MSASVIVDTSLVVDLLTNVPNVAQGVEKQGTILHAPYALEVEFMNVLRNRWLHGLISSQEGTRLVRELERMIAVHHPHDGLLDRAWALRDNVTAYDSLFVALAEHLDIPLLTRDRRLSRSSGHSARIEFIE